MEELRRIRSRGWIKNARPGNAGSIGNTLEDLLGIEENNLPIPNAVEWELKCQKANTSSLTTLFTWNLHLELSDLCRRFCCLYMVDLINLLARAMLLARRAFDKQLALWLTQIAGSRLL